MVNSKKHSFVVFISLIMLTPMPIKADSLNPKDYGVMEELSGVERYNILMKVHKEAVATGKSVTYEGIDKLELEIPENATSIPLPMITDFAGVELIVKNNKKSLHLFFMQGERIPVELDKRSMKKNVFRSIPKLRNGRKLLIIEDESPWVEQRIGYDVGVKRKDILYLKRGRAQNKPVQTYTSSSSNPRAYYYEASTEQHVFKNLVFKRTNSSTMKTYLVHFNCIDNIEINNVTTFTPRSTLYADQIFAFTDCSNLSFQNVVIDGTYSQIRKYGYGISMNNVWHSNFSRLKAHGNWGVFGNYCVNDATIEDSEINRFDIHCYGKDVKSVRCKFEGLYNQFSSVYGTISFDECEFKNFVPLLIEASFNAYTPFDLKWNNCTFYLDARHNYLLTLSGVPEEENNRPELKRKYLPNIFIYNCSVVLADDVKKWFVVWSNGVNYKESFEGINTLLIQNLDLKGQKEITPVLFSKEVRTTKPIKTMITLK